MFFQPTGPRLTVEQVIELDDDFFGSDLVGYFHSRVEGLIQERDSSGASSTVGAAIGKLIGPWPGILQVSERDRELQVAFDAFSLRHHAAECLVRLYLAVALHTGAADESVWLSIADGPTQLKELVDQARTLLASEASRTGYWRLIVDEDIVEHNLDMANQAVDVSSQWLRRAMQLLVAADLDLNAGHNKVKHGLAIRAHNDLRTAITRIAPDADGTMPASAFAAEDGRPLFTRATMQFLSRPPVGGRKNSHVELGMVQLVPELLLVEVLLMSSVIGALFFQARRAHLFRHHENESARRAPEAGDLPRLPLGPTPKKLLGNAFVGQRSPLTAPADGTPGRSEALIFEQEVIELNVDVANRMRNVRLRN